MQESVYVHHTACLRECVCESAQERERERERERRAKKPKVLLCGFPVEDKLKLLVEKKTTFLALGKKKILIPDEIK